MGGSVTTPFLSHPPQPPPPTCWCSLELPDKHLHWILASSLLLGNQTMAPTLRLGNFGSLYISLRFFVDDLGNWKWFVSSLRNSHVRYQTVRYEEVKWKLADDVIFCHIICTWRLGWPRNIVESLQCLNIFVLGYLFPWLWIYNFGKWSAFIFNGRCPS